MSIDKKPYSFVIFQGGSGPHVATLWIRAWYWSAAYEMPADLDYGIYSVLNEMIYMDPD